MEENNNDDINDKTISHIDEMNANNADKLNHLTEKIDKIEKKVNIIFWLVIASVACTVVGLLFPTLF